MQDDAKHLFDEYIVQGETSRKQRAENWQIAIGLQDVDRLQNSPYLLETAKEHIEGNIDFAAVQKRITDYYQTEEGRKLAAARSDEADKVASRISEVLEEDACSTYSVGETPNCFRKTVEKCARVLNPTE